MLSHVDARWIKQRPHFMAEGMNDADFDVTFAYARAFSRRAMVGGGVSCKSVPLLVVPNGLRSRRVWKRIDAVVQILWAVALAIVRRPDVVWLTGPRLGRCALWIRRMTGSRLVYDYMDRNALFDDATTAVAREEQNLLGRADLVLCSSSALLDDVERLAPTIPSLLVRNALADPGRWRPNDSRLSPPGAERVLIGYAGTISSWFDTGVVDSALEREPGWRVSAWGPCDVEMPGSDRFVWNGVVAHHVLPEALGSCDVLVMPFRLTPLIEAVDPVKAYEYIATGLPVVLPRYNGTDHFEPFAHRYTPGDADDFIRAVKAAVCAQRLEPADVFTEQNTWTIRVTAVAEQLGRWQ